MNMFGVKTSTLIANSEVYTTMKENATFLLELCSSVTPASAANNAVAQNLSSKRSPQQMPVVMEHSNFNVADFNKPSTSRGDRNSRVSLRMSGKFEGNNKFIN